MVRVALATLLIAAALACTPSAGADRDCTKLCRELVQECSYAAYPSFESCEQGCAYNETEGADVPAQLACIEEAACDTFAIVECEHNHGAESR